MIRDRFDNDALRISMLRDLWEILRGLLATWFEQMRVNSRRFLGEFLLYCKGCTNVLESEIDESGKVNLGMIVFSSFVV